MNINEIKKSNFIKKEDCGSGILVTIKGLVQENVAMEGSPEDMQWCLIFNELEKPMILKSTNAQLIASILKSEETDDWIGKKVVLYNDPNVVMKGKVTGGLRVRAPKTKAVAAEAAPKAVNPLTEEDDDVPV